ncbi:Cas10/Cmr2 second palm domain-containing protein [Actinopolyspora sp. H202]|uniref:Cas10/Cmr2 second palm domain-containing protein n=1 Tax=Actinopolyspora sp. H202 TaxID=1500456 RepID=UPI003EE6BC6C
MSLYLDIGVVRIQSWLSRAPHLRGRRGASAMIREATKPAKIDELLTGWQDIVERCTEAGDVDGVVPLVMHSEAPEAVSRVEDHVTTHLRSLLPGASLRTELRAGKYWLEAQNGPVRAEREWPAVVAEWPPGKQCDWCRTWPASRQRMVGAKEKRELKSLCPDCLLREEHAGYSTSRRQEMAPGTERDLLKGWEDRPPQRPMAVPDTSQVLAELGERRDNTHLATVYADGNAIGGLGDEVREAQDRGRGTTFKLPASIEHATWSALLDAVETITDDDATMLPVIAHLIGGDDVLVSVPAHRAWAFAHTLQTRFSEYLGARLAEADLAGITTPTISTGVVFHHHKSPLSSAIDLAEEHLKRAKKEHRGLTAALAWQDVTHDGPLPVHDRPSVSVEDLAASWPELSRLADCGGSARANLAALARDGGHAELMRHAERIGLDELVRRLIDGPVSLEHAVGMTRWWRTA